MRVVLQRVSSARVEVDGSIVGSIGSGLMVLLGVSKEDTRADAEYLVGKVLELRVFPDDAGKMNRSLVETRGSLLIVSQFTLYGDCRKGRRPSYDRAAPPEKAKELYDHFVDTARSRGVEVQTGTFQASMSVHLVNEGPVTLVLDGRG
jgi:D-tyrosyl-tRNA(Tyr) deacylase